MAKTTAPALSFSARGAIAKTMVFSKWRGVPYVRQHVIPSNPRTTKQQSVRKSFALLREIFKLAPPALIAPWNAFAVGRPFTGMNKFVGENQRVLNGQTTLDNIIASPGAKGGLPPSSIALTSPVAGHIHVVAALPDLPDGWTASGAYGVAFQQQAPDGYFVGGLNMGQETVAPFSTFDITGLTTGEDYVVAVYLTQTRPDGSTAYSVSVSDIITVS